MWRYDKAGSGYPTYQDVICLECRILLDQKGLWTFYGEEIEELERLWAKT